MGHLQREYAYRPKWTTVFLCGGFFGVCAAVALNAGLTSDRGLVVNGVVRLSPAEARVFWAIVAAVAGAFVLASILLACFRLTTRLRIVVTDTGILLPTGRWTRHSETHVDFADINCLKTVEFQGQHFLYIYAKGLRYTVTSDMLPAKTDFDEIVRLLKSQSDAIE